MNKTHLADWLKICFEYDIEYTPLDITMHKSKFKGNHNSVNGTKIIKYNFKYDYPKLNTKLLNE